MFEAEASVTGDVWVSEGELDMEYVDAMKIHAEKFIQSKRQATVEEVTTFLRKVQVSKVDFANDDIKKLLEMMVYDGLLETVPVPRNFLAPEMKNMYRCTNIKPKKIGYVQAPCVVCPVFELCTDDGDISPKSCAYYREWLEF